MSSTLTVFGFSAGGASAALRDQFVQFGEMLAKRVRGEVALFEASSYEDLTTAVVSQYVDVAWLPPIPFVSLERQRAVVPLVHLRRRGQSTFRSAIVVKADSPIRTLADLSGKRAAWVDPYSASGFVVPRIELEKAGVDPRVAFARQRFFHSHEAVRRAVLGGLADFGATYAGVAPDGSVDGGPLRVLALLGEIPGDVVAARAGATAATRDRIRDALVRISTDGKSKLLARGAFGVDEFCAFDPAGYAELRHATEDASERGLLDVPAGPDQSGAHTLL